MQEFVLKSLIKCAFITEKKQCIGKSTSGVTPLENSAYTHIFQQSHCISNVTKKYKSFEFHNPQKSRNPKDYDVRIACGT